MTDAKIVLYVCISPEACLVPLQTLTDCSITYRPTLAFHHLLTMPVLALEPGSHLSNSRQQLHPHIHDMQVNQLLSIQKLLRLLRIARIIKLIKGFKVIIARCHHTLVTVFSHVATAPISMFSGAFMQAIHPVSTQKVQSYASDLSTVYEACPCICLVHAVTASWGQQKLQEAFCTAGESPPITHRHNLGASKVLMGSSELIGQSGCTCQRLFRV